MKKPTLIHLVDNAFSRESARDAFACATLKQKREAAQFLAVDMKALGTELAKRAMERFYPHMKAA